MLAAILVIIAIDSIWSIRREEELILQNMKENATLLGETTGKLFAEVWRFQGQQTALALISEVNRSEHRIKVRWVSTDSNAIDLYAPQVPLEQLLKVPRDSVAAFTVDHDSVAFMVVYLPISVTEPALGFLEMSESFYDLNAQSDKILMRTILLSAALVLVAGIVLLTIGTYFVGHPLRQLVQRTQRIGAGDFSHDNSLPGHDELAQLSMSLDAMCDQLGTAQNDIRVQSERRVEAVQQLRHSDRLATVGRLASGVAHELGTPLNVISGRAKMLSADGQAQGESLESLRIIAQQADRMAGIIRQLLDFARQRHVSRGSTDMVGLVKQTIDLLQSMARKASVEIKLSVPATLPHVFVDSGQIQQALINVLVNGIQAMPEGGTVAVTLSVDRKLWPMDQSRGERPCMVIRIADEGTGISEELTKQIFDPFFTTKEVGSGTGLGLSITHGIIEDHGGFITVQSVIDSGTTFAIHLPLEEEL